MIFKRLYLKNFLSVGENPVEIDFTKQSGLTLIKGQNLDISGKSSNGAGKSTIIEGILFALYGKTLRKLKKDEYCINEKAKSDCVVELEFDDVKIIRRFVLDKKGKKKETKVEFLVAGQIQGTNASSVKVSEEITNYIKVSFETMCNILIFGQHNMISFLDAGEPEKREIVENLMNLKEWNLYEEKARTQLRESKNKYKVSTETHEAQDKILKEHEAFILEQQSKSNAFSSNLALEIAALKAKINSVPNYDIIQKQWEEYQLAEAKKAELNNNIQSLQSELVQISDNLSKLFESKRNEESNKQPLNDLINQLNNRKIELSNRLEKARKEYCEPIKELITEAESSIQTIRAEKTQALYKISLIKNWDICIRTANDELLKIAKEVNAIKNKELIQDAICPECFGAIDLKNCQHILSRKEKELVEKQKEMGQLIIDKEIDSKRVENETVSVSEKYEEQISTVKKNIEGLQEKLSSYESQLIGKFNSATEELSKELSINLEKICLFDKRIENLYKVPIEEQQLAKTQKQNQISALNDQVKVIVSKKPDITLEEVAKQQAESEAYKKQLLEKENTKNPYTDILHSLNEKQKSLKENADNSYKELKEVEKLIPYYEYLLSVFGKEGIKSFVIDQIVPTLNQQVEYWMQILYQGAIKVTFDKLLNVTLVNNASQNEMVFGQGSGGERRRIDLAVMLAFRQVMKLSTNKDPNIVFMDEVAENLDEDGVYRLYDALLDLAKTGQVYVITHNSALLGLMSGANTIIVKKQNGIMELV